MKLITIVGARPQFIKIAVICNAIKKYNREANSNIEHVLIHTGQHFDNEMNDVFFRQMQIDEPKYNLNINSVSHGAMVGRMLEQIEEILKSEKPDFVLVYGDTNSTLAGALAAKKLSIKIAHIESGLRSFNEKMPEEVNRIISDRLSDILFCPSKNAIKNLKDEGFKNFKHKKIIFTGDVMYDSILTYANQAICPAGIDIVSGKFILATVHRQENTDDTKTLGSIINALEKLSKNQKVIFPIHPRTKKILETNNYDFNTSGIDFINPVGYFEMLYLLQNCSFVFTDSGGLQKEAYFHKKKCITLRDETEWVELVDNNYNIIAGTREKNILDSYEKLNKSTTSFKHNIYGNGNAGEIIISELVAKITSTN